jgi:hypothetical protein
MARAIWLLMVLWRGDFETGNTSQWTSQQAVAPDRLRVVTSPVDQGKHALRVEVRQGDDPINASGDRAELVRSNPLEVEGNERFYAWSTMWPANYPSVKTWQLFAQWHHTGLNGSPPMELIINGEQISLRVGAQTTVWQAPLVRGPWHRFVFHVKWSSNPQVGFVELWYDGQLVLPKRMIATMYPGQSNYLKLGLYRNDIITETGVIFHDGMVVGTTLADVLAPAADGGAPPDAGAPDDAAVAAADLAAAAPPADPQLPGPADTVPAAPEVPHLSGGCHYVPGGR